MYIESVPNRNSPPAILLRESYRDGGKIKKRTIANLSSWPTDIIEGLRTLLKGGKVAAADQETIVVRRALPHGHVAAVLGTLRDIGLDRLLGPAGNRCRDLVIAMIVARLIAPASKLATARMLDPLTAALSLGETLGLGSVDEDELYVALDWLGERQEAVEKALARKHLRAGMLVLYDVSSSYVEGRCCELAQLGYNRDGKKGKLQIVYGLLCARDGCPVAIEVFEGDTADPRTLATQIDKVKKRFALDHVVLVGDRGMITQARIDGEIAPAGLDWITALRAPAIRELADAGALQMSLFDDRDMAAITSPDYPGEPCRMLPGSGVKLCVGRCGDVARDAEQGTEGVERIEPPVEAEGEFVEVGLQVLVTDPVMDAVQPRFQVCEDEMDDWQILLGDLRIAPFSDGEVFVAALGKAGVAAPVVGDERRARHNGALNEAAERLRAAVRHDGEPNPPGIATTLPLVELGARLALANLHSAGDKNLIVDATAFAARPAASPGFIDFDVLAGPAADPVLIRAHHPRAELVEDLERRLVARQAKLSPKLHGRHAGCLAGHQIGRPKPYAQRRVRARHDRSHRQSGVTAALAVAQDARTICEAERLSRRLTMGANKPVAPASLLQVGGAGRVVGKKSLELWERLWEPKIATLVNVHEHGRTLPLEPTSPGP